VCAVNLGARADSSRFQGRGQAIKSGPLLHRSSNRECINGLSGKGWKLIGSALSV